jgi:hypothetical protein
MDAKQIKQEEEALNRQAGALVAQINDGLLSAGEAAMCLAGFHQKQIEKAGRPYHDSGLSYYKMVINRQLPGHDGLSPDTHFQ